MSDEKKTGAQRSPEDPTEGLTGFTKAVAQEYEGEDKIINTIARLTGKPGGASYEEVQSMRVMLRGRGTR